MKFETSEDTCSPYTSCFVLDQAEYSSLKADLLMISEEEVVQIMVEFFINLIYILILFRLFNEPSATTRFHRG